MVSYWFIWLIHSLIIYQLSFSTKRSSSSALRLKHPSHFTCSTIINTCSVYPSSPQKDVTVFHSVSLGWLVTSMSIWSQYQYMFCLCPPPPLPLITVPDPQPPNWTGCLPVFLYMCIYVYTRYLIHDRRNPSSLNQYMFLVWC